jgi:hypothetical protein
MMSYESATTVTSTRWTLAACERERERDKERRERETEREGGGEDGRGGRERERSERKREVRAWRMPISQREREWERGGGGGEREREERDRREFFPSQTYLVGKCDEESMNLVKCAYFFPLIFQLFFCADLPGGKLRRGKREACEMRLWLSKGPLPPLSLSLSLLSLPLSCSLSLARSEGLVKCAYDCLKGLSEILKISEKTV